MEKYLQQALRNGVQAFSSRRPRLRVISLLGLQDEIKNHIPSICLLSQKPSENAPHRSISTPAKISSPLSHIRYLFCIHREKMNETPKSKMPTKNKATIDMPYSLACGTILSLLLVFDNLSPAFEGSASYFRFRCCRGALLGVRLLATTARLLALPLALAGLPRRKTPKSFP